ncbi:proline--tRNA ligase [candidate division WWE3 bacterium RIFCSPHIGHO2_01_FULL_40_23]|uniref:Proline--tRNA ligase n=1 Tax=candidate division WWE3 bacterium RIFCSPLOWO2_01_FULL_41_18 TaxID=1802625 RepID=A0A1F4VF44_UNCKA|nr:MAG: proline--tRNA ligase [candidate division WWE3 bacterium RIFCSPHIGHO2_01_FULL_40_23]OGC55588.1 MAG: proline--tRNA ligase [candidate division WWE3 bacterium RIFCSPLOWO2_01_FULL_41_18]
MAYDKSQKKKKSENISDWYNDIVVRADLADYSPVKGCMVIKPYGYGIWELLQAAMDPLIKEKGVRNGYFPIFIPISLLNKEKSHVEGFSPELAIVTHGGGEELSEPLAVRPTSETIMYEMYKKWVQSWRDLPLLINQWNNVVRWEKRTYLFLRTTEFLWQEGHTAHATHEEAWDFVLWAANMYRGIYRDYFAIPGFVGKKSESEKFAGAVTTLSFEAMMPDGKALQNCTSHDLGQNFSKAFDISFQNKDSKKEYVWQTSWGFSTRSIGALVLAHGDDKGLRLPPKLAPIQVIILPVQPDDSKQLTRSNELATELSSAGIRAEVDGREDETLGFRINKWEVKGVPIRVEVGPKEIESGSYLLVRRDTFEKFNSKNITKDVSKALASIQSNLLAQAEENLKKLTSEINNFKEFEEIMRTKKGFIRAFWCEDKACEESIKGKTKAGTRCLLLDEKEEKGKCVYCGNEAKHKWIFAQAY